MVMFRTVGQNIGGATQHDPGEASPVLVPTVHRDGNGWVLLDVADSLERDVGALGLLVDGDIEGATIEVEANRHEMRRTVAASSRQVGNAYEVEEAPLRIGQHSGIPWFSGSRWPPDADVPHAG